MDRILKDQEFFRNACGSNLPRMKITMSITQVKVCKGLRLCFHAYEGNWY